MKKVINFWNTNWFVILITLYSLWILSLLTRNYSGFDDFDIFYRSGTRLLNHENIYGEPHFLGMFKYYYSVFFACIMAAIQFLGPGPAKLIWFCINYAAMIRILFVIKANIFHDIPHSKLLVLVFLMLSGKFVLHNYTSNQLTILILWIILEAYVQVKNGKVIVPAILLCIGINLKLLPLAVAPWLIFICVNKRKMLTTISLGLLFLLFLPALFIGWDYNNMLTVQWLQTINPLSHFHVIQTSEGGLLDISSLGTKYLTSENVGGETPINILSLSTAWLFIVTNFARLILFGVVMMAAVIIRRPIFGIHPHLLVLAAFMTLIPLCFPHQRLYSYLFILPMLAILMAITLNLGSKPEKLFFIVLSLFTGLLTWVDITGVAVVDFFNLYRLTTIGTSMMLVFYVYMLLKFGAGYQPDMQKYLASYE